MLQAPALAVVTERNLKRHGKNMKRNTRKLTMIKVGSDVA